MRLESSAPLLLLPLFLLLNSGVANADHRDRDRHYGQRYAPSATIVYARVTDVRPLIEQVRTQVPVRECYESTAYAPPAYDSRDGTGYGPARAGSTVGGTIVGGVVGGAIGDRFGRGEGRDAMRLLGALVGAAIGHDAATRRQAAYYPQQRSEAYPVEECTTRYESRIEERTRGYEVAYVYEGREYYTETAAPPGDRIPIEVSVRPAL